jgi:tRNA (cmo5U34)-methyltransferase
VCAKSILGNGDWGRLRATPFTPTDQSGATAVRAARSGADASLGNPGHDAIETAARSRPPPAPATKAFIVAPPSWFTDFPRGESMPKDQIFADKAKASDFRFDNKTVAVFDDMVDRSVPFYGEIQRMIGEMAADFAVDGTNLYDLGCSTGTTLLLLDALVSPGVHFIGVDNSPEMLDEVRRKFALANFTRSHDLVPADLHQGPHLENASVVIMNLTLQFIRPLYRDKLIANIARGTNDNGCLILVEKLTVADTLLNRLFITYYYGLKRRSEYSDLEIAQKREALENVLIPYRFNENVDMLLSAGFRSVEVFFRWYNFCGMIAVR